MLAGSRLKLACPARLGAAAITMAVWLVSASPASASTPTCGVTWTGQGGNHDWSNPVNWSTSKVPSASSDVCIDNFGVIAPTSISVHSLQLLGQTQLDSADVAGSSINVATSLVIGQHVGQLVLDGTLKAATIDNAGTITTLSNSGITSPAFSNTGTVLEEEGTLEVPDVPVQLQHGNLTGGKWDAVNGVLAFPQDISQLTGGAGVDLEFASAIQDPAGHSALTSLSTIGAGSVLEADRSPLSLDGNLVSQGEIELGGYVGGGSLSIAGRYTQESGALSSLNQVTLTAQGVSIDSGSKLDGAGTINGSVTNSGTIIPINSIAINGNYTQTAQGTLDEFFGTSLTVSANAVLSGALDLSVNRQCPPPPGSSFPAVTFATRHGLFTSHTAGFALKVQTHAIEAIFGGASPPAAPAC
jgi:hypothetical protein